MAKEKKAIKEKEKERCRSTFYYEGKQYEATGKTQKEADQKAAIKKDKLKRGEVGIAGNMTVKKWGETYLEVYVKPSVGEETYKSYKHYINNVISPEIGSLLIKNVTDIHLQKILNDRMGYSKSDLTKLRMIMRALFRKAHKAKPKPLISQNPAEDLVLPAAEEGTHRSITEYEREKILEVTDTHKTAGLLVKTFLYAGLRPNETRALDWRHIDFEKQRINVENAQKAGTKKIGGPKTEAGVRHIPINDDLLPGLLAAKAEEEARIKKAYANNTDNIVYIIKIQSEPVFKQPTTGRRHTKTSMKRLWNNFKNQLDIAMGAKFGKEKAKDGKMRKKKILSVVAEDLVPYCLRHTFCTDLEEAGVPINVAKYLMGHKHISTTAKIYTHTTEKTIQNAADQMNTHAEEKRKKADKKKEGHSETQ